MKKEILLTIGLLLLCTNVFAQNTTVTDSKIREKDDKVTVTFTVVTDKVKNNERVTLTPILFNGDKRAELKPVIIAGRKRMITDRRKSSVQGIRTQKDQHIPYDVTIPYEKWMSSVSFMIDRKVESCCKERESAPLPLATTQNVVIRYDVAPPYVEPVKSALSEVEQQDIKSPFLAPMAEYTAFKENRDMMRTEGALIIRFKQGNSVINPDFEDNASSLEQVREVLELIESDKNASVGKVVLAGASSPEGSIKFNDELAQKRARALQSYLKDKTHTGINLVESINLGEDWVGLRQLVEQSDMQYKQEVLDIINDVPVVQGRKKQLMDLKGGRPYKYMLEHLFPQLRSAGYIRIFYESKPDEQFVKTNDAISLYNNNEYNDAIARLDGVPPTAVTENIRGTCYMMIGQYDKAQQHLNRAVQMGNTQATESLEQIKKLQSVQQ